MSWCQNCAQVETPPAELPPHGRPQLGGNDGGRAGGAGGELGGAGGGMGGGEGGNEGGGGEGGAGGAAGGGERLSQQPVQSQPMCASSSQLRRWPRSKHVLSAHGLSQRCGGGASGAGEGGGCGGGCDGGGGGGGGGKGMGTMGGSTTSL